MMMPGRHQIFPRTYQEELANSVETHKKEQSKESNTAHVVILHLESP